MARCSNRCSGVSVSSRGGHPVLQPGTVDHPGERDRHRLRDVDLPGPATGLQPVKDRLGAFLANHLLIGLFTWRPEEVAYLRPARAHAGPAITSQGSTMLKPGSPGCRTLNSKASWLSSPLAVSPLLRAASMSPVARAIRAAAGTVRVRLTGLSLSLT